MDTHGAPSWRSEFLFLFLFTLFCKMNLLSVILALTHTEATFSFAATPLFATAIKMSSFLLKVVKVKTPGGLG